MHFCPTFCRYVQQCRGPTGTATSSSAAGPQAYPSAPEPVCRIINASGIRRNVYLLHGPLISINGVRAMHNLHFKLTCRAFVESEKGTLISVHRSQHCTLISIRIAKAIFIDYYLMMVK